MCHDAKPAGRRVIGKTLDNARRHFWWRGVDENARVYVEEFRRASEKSQEDCSSLFPSPPRRGKAWRWTSLRAYLVRTQATTGSSRQPYHQQRERIAPLVHVSLLRHVTGSPSHTVPPAENRMQFGEELMKR